MTATIWVSRLEAIQTDIENEIKTMYAADPKPAGIDMLIAWKTDQMNAIKKAILLVSTIEMLIESDWAELKTKMKSEDQN